MKPRSPVISTTRSSRSASSQSVCTKAALTARLLRQVHDDVANETKRRASTLGRSIRAIRERFVVVRVRSPSTLENFLDVLGCFSCRFRRFGDAFAPFLVGRLVPLAQVAGDFFAPLAHATPFISGTIAKLPPFVDELFSELASGFRREEKGSHDAHRGSDEEPD